MRIISGKFGGHRFHPPKKLPYRPTTDIAKSGLFNILNNHWDYEDISVLDLFSGTGMVSLEFASRGCANITSVDLNFGCVKYLKDNTKKLDIKGIKSLKSDAFKFITKFNKQVDIVFASPPYAIEKDIPKLSDLVFEHNILKPDGWCIVETNDLVILDEKPYFSFKRNYGSTVFNFFEWNPEK